MELSGGSNKKARLGKIILVAVMSGLQTMSVSHVMSNLDVTYLFYGNSFFEYNPVSLVFFVLDFILLWRFFRVEAVLKNKARWIISAVFGLLMGLSTVWGAYMIYGTNHIFDDGKKVIAGYAAAIGMAFLFTPIVSEIIGFLDKNETREVLNEKPGKKKTIGYLFLVWGIVFLSFIPVFLYWWPGNFVADAGYQVTNWMTDTMSDHHPILHTVILGSLYELGYNNGNVNYGIQIYSLSQMLLMSGSFGFFMSHLYEKNVRRSIRVITILLFVLNPVNAYYSITTIKGTWCVAFLLVALKFMLKLLDDFRVPYIIAFSFFGILSCLFRNNMIYAFIAGSAIILVTIVIKKKGIGLFIGVLAAAILVTAGTKGVNQILLKATDAGIAQHNRESMSFPLMCLARTMIDHKDELDPALYDEICSYFPEECLTSYTYINADYIKNYANEALLRDNKISFYKLFIKTEIKYPEEVVETFVGLTCGYWYLGDAPYFLNGTTKLYTMSEGYDLGIENRNLLPVGSAVYDMMYGDLDGRMRIPVFGWMWRGGKYFWIYLFAFVYSIYRKNTKAVMVIAIPLMYLMTDLLGPTPFLRYMYINIATIPMFAYLLIYNENNNEIKNRNT